MRLVHVIHGYPPRYNAGSEVYTQNLCRALARRHEVHVFTREEDPFRPDFAVRTEADAGDPRVALHVVNVARSRDRYRHAGVDQRFAELLDRVHPDVVHVGHLNHLSTSLVREASARDSPIRLDVLRRWIVCGQPVSCRCTPTTDEPVRSCTRSVLVRDAPAGATPATSRAPTPSSPRTSITGRAGSPGGCSTSARWPSSSTPSSPGYEHRPARSPSCGRALARQARAHGLRLRPSSARGPTAATRRAVHVRLHRHAHPREGRAALAGGVRAHRLRRTAADLGSTSRTGNGRAPSVG